MKIKTIYILLMVAALFAACTADDDMGSMEAADESVTISLGISANNTGTRDTHQGEDSYAKNGEYINHVQVFVVDATTDKIAAILTTTFDNDQQSLADVGNLTDYLWTNVSLVENKTYHFYSFANYKKKDGNYYKEANGSVTLESIMKKNVGEDLTQEMLQNVVLDNPVYYGDLNDEVAEFNKSFIPMSGWTLNQTITKDQHIDIYMDRLVGKVILYITNDNDNEMKINPLTFANYANRVSLFHCGFPASTSAITDNNKSSETAENTNSSNVATSYKKFELKTDFTIPATTTTDGVKTYETKSLEFYINETSTANPYKFEITLSTGENITYYAQTQHGDLKRNHVYVINLSLSRADVKLNLEALAVPIDHEPIVYTTATDIVDTKVNLIKVHDVTSRLKITPEAVNNLQGKVTWAWDNVETIKNKLSGVAHDVSITDGALCIDYFRAQANSDIDPINLTGTWTNTTNGNTTNHSRTYQIQLKVVDDIPEYSESQIAAGAPRRENIVMRRKE